MPGTTTPPIITGITKKKLSTETANGMMTMTNKTKRKAIRKEKESVHLLLCGHSTDHLKRVIEVYNPIHMDFFTSEELRPHLEAFLKSIQDFSGTFHIEDIPAFTEDSIREGSSTIMSRYLILKKLFPSRSFYFGITGGTNTMAVEMALAALASSEKIHYVIYGNERAFDGNTIITFDTLELKNMIMNNNIQGEEIHYKL